MLDGCGWRGTRRGKIGGSNTRSVACDGGTDVARGVPRDDASIARHAPRERPRANRSARATGDATPQLSPNNRRVDTKPLLPRESRPHDARARDRSTHSSLPQQSAIFANGTK